MLYRAVSYPCRRFSVDTQRDRTEAPTCLERTSQVDISRTVRLLGYDLDFCRMELMSMIIDIGPDIPHQSLEGYQSGRGIDRPSCQTFENILGEAPMLEMLVLPTGSAYTGRVEHPHTFCSGERRERITVHSFLFLRRCIPAGIEEQDFACSAFTAGWGRDETQTARR